MKKKTLWLLGMLVAMMLFVVACGSDDEASKSNEGKSSSETTDGAENAEGCDEVTTFHFFDASGPGEDLNTGDTVLGKKFEEDTCINFDVEHIVGDVNQKIGTMIAGGQYPHLLNAEQSTDAVIDAGGFVPLNDLIEEHAPNIKKWYGPYLEFMKRSDGNIYIIPSGASNGYIKPPNIYQGGWWIKREVLKELGYPQPKTLDDFFGIIEEYVSANPQIDGMDTIGFTALTDDWRFFALSNQPNHLAGYPNDGGVQVDMETHEAKVYNNNEDTKRWLKTLNEANAKGLIDQEMFTQNYEEYLAKIATGRVVGFFDYHWQVADALNTIREDEDFYSEYMAFPVVFDENIKDQYLDPVGFAASPGQGITTATTEEERIQIIKFLDYLMQEEIQKMITWGIEGETYSVDEDGMFYQTEEQYEKTSKQAFREEFGFTEFEWGWPRLNGLFSDGNAVEARNQPSVAQMAYNDVDKEFLEAYGIETFAELFTEPDERPWFPAYDAPIETGSQAQVYEQQLDDLMKRMYPQMILNDPNEFESLWESYSAEFEQLPYEEFEQVMTEYIKGKVKVAEEAAAAAE